MFKRILFYSLFILIFIIPLKQDSNAKTWERYNTTVLADSILAVIERADSVIIDKCEILGSLEVNLDTPLVEILPEGGLLVKFPGETDTVKSFISITRSTFSKVFTCINCYFMENVYLHSDTCSGNADFTRSTFRKDALFNSSTFGSAEFEKVTFDEEARFDGTTFGDVSFFLTTFDSSASFFSTAFNGIAQFSGATFRGQLILRPKQFQNIYISWSQIQHHHASWSLFDYVRIMKNFEELRQLGDADGVYLFLKEQERVRKPWYVRYPEFWLFQLPCGYGVKPLNTLYLSLVIVLIFMLVFSKSNAIKEIEREFGYRKRRKRYRAVNRSFGKRLYDALYFSIHTFIIGIVVDWYPTDEFLVDTRRINIFRFRIFRIAGSVSDRRPTEEFLVKARGIRLFKFRTLAMIEGVLGWVLLVLFVVTLTRKFIR